MAESLSPFARWLLHQRGTRSMMAIKRSTAEVDPAGRGVDPRSLSLAERDLGALSYRSLRLLCRCYGASYERAVALMNAARTERERSRERARKEDTSAEDCLSPTRSGGSDGTLG